MKVLILGSNGNLGQQLVRIFSQDNNVIAWDKSEIDITDSGLVSKKIKELKPDAIINAAAYNAVDKCECDETELETAKKLNADAPANLARAALETGAIIMHFSTDYVFGGYGHNKSKTFKEIKIQGGFNEDDEPRPANKYGQTKLAGEQEIIKLSGKGLKWYLVRTSKLFGPKGSSKFAKPSFFDMMLKMSNEGGFAKASESTGKALEVVDDEISCFTYTPDLAGAARKLIDEGKGYGIYHITNGKPSTWYKAAMRLFRIAKINIKVKPVASDHFPRAAKRPKYSVLHNTKLEPLRDYNEALREYLKS